MKFQAKSDLRAFNRNMAKAKVEQRLKVRAALDIAGKEVLNHVRSLTNETKPGTRSGDGPRQVHPGGWADVTSNLVNSLNSQVLPSKPKTETLEMAATMEYAEFIESKEGYTLLAGGPEMAREIMREVMQ